MKPGNIVKFNGEEEPFVIIGRTRGRDGKPLIVLEDIRQTTVKLLSKDEIIRQAIPWNQKIPNLSNNIF